MVKSREAATAQYQAQVTQLTTALAREALLKARETWVLQSKVQALSGRLTSARAMLTKCHASLVSATQESTALHSQNQALREKLDTKVAENREEARHRQNETRRADHYRCLHHQAKLKVERQRKQAARASKRRPITLDKAKDDAKRFRLKCKGIWKPVVRTGFARLRAHGVSAKKMDKILKIAAKMFGGKVQETVSERTVGRSTHEAGIMGQLQLMHEIKHAECQYSHLGLIQLLTTIIISLYPLWRWIIVPKYPTRVTAHTPQPGSV
jgi:regulator of replication initiation timing